MSNLILPGDPDFYAWPTPGTQRRSCENGDYLMLQGVYPFKLPKPPSDEKEIFFYDKKPEDQFWQRIGPPADWAVLSASKKERYIEEESMRCFVTGAHIFIKGLPVWIPPAFWFTLNWWYMKDGYMKLRVAQLLEEYFEIFCENDPWCVGTFRFKKRRDGLTTRRMARKIWKAIQTKDGWFGLQSKTGNDAKKVCWKILMTGWKRLPTFFYPEMGGMTDPKTMLEFKKPSERITKSNVGKIFGDDVFQQNRSDDDLNTTIDWRDTTDDAYDGQQLVEVTIDEFCKWKKASALDALYTYIKCCTLDGEKVGMIHAITSPPETDGRGLEEGQELWDASNYDEIIKNPNRTFNIYRWFTSALDSYAGAIDKYGYCDQDLADQKIKEERAAAPNKKKKAVIRQTPRYIDEIFDQVDNNVFITAPEIKKRDKYLRTTDYKDLLKKEPKYIYGNFDWQDGIRFSEVIFKPSENQEDFSWTGRWAIIKFPTENGCGNEWRIKMFKGAELKLPPWDSEHVLGIDPYDFKRTDSTGESFGSGVIGKCFDFHGIGDIDDICALYNFRPKDPDVFYEDQLKGAIFYGAWVNSESRNIKIFDFFEENGYFEYMLPKDITNSKKKDIKGTPTTGTTIQEICSLTEAYTATCLNQVWHEAITDDWLHFNPNNTKKSNITMACGHMFIGFAKRRRLYKKTKKQTPENSNNFVEALAETFF